MDSRAQLLGCTLVGAAAGFALSKVLSKRHGRQSSKRSNHGASRGRDAVRTARKPQLHVPKDQVESAEPKVHEPGATLWGPSTWASGVFTVVAGEASVVLHIGGQKGDDVEVARLMPGDTYGWSCACVSWDEFAPRIIVGEQGFQTCHQGWHATEDEDTGMTFRLGDLWRRSSATEKGLASYSGTFLKAQFLASLWIPLIDKFSDDLQVMWEKRHEKGLTPNECFPFTGPQIAECCRYVLQLSEMWYGSERGGNLSAFYIWFMKSMQLIGVMAYRMDNIAQERSKDGWAVFVDGGARAAALKATQGQGGDSLLSQKQGRSAIDNTVLRNLYTPGEARMMCEGRKVREALCCFIKFRQLAVLRRLSSYFNVDPGEMGFDIVGDRAILRENTGNKRHHRLIRSMLQLATPEDFKHMRVDPDGFSVKLLTFSGVVLETFDHQLKAEHRKIINDALPKLLDVEASARNPTAESDSVFEKFIAWVRDHPGQFYQYDKTLHRTIRFAGHFYYRKKSEKKQGLVMFRRSDIEKMSLAKYFTLQWRRQQPLWGVWPDETVQVRGAGVMEASAVRANEAPYCNLHAMSLSAGALASESHTSRKLDRRMSSEKSLDKEKHNYSDVVEFQLVHDPTANLSNWFFTDIEKILNESWQLNPRGPKEILLPWEGFVNVGQNPKVGSSIKRTQHTQMCNAGISKYPIFQLSTNPQASEQLNATVDLVDVAEQGTPAETHGLFVKIVTKRPTGSALIKFLVGLRKKLLESLGGADKVDFFVMCMSDENGGYVIIFACLPQLEKIGDQAPDYASWLNPLTGQSTEDVGLQEARIDFGKGVGHFLVLKPALKSQVIDSGELTVRRIWAFNRVPGSRKVIDDFIIENGIFEKTVPGAA